MDIINGIARGVSPCVRPHQFLPLKSECCGREVPTKVVCVECLKMCRLGGKNSVVKGLICGWRINESHKKSANHPKVVHIASLGHYEGPFSSTMNSLTL